MNLFLKVYSQWHKRRPDLNIRNRCVKFKCLFLDIEGTIINENGSSPANKDKKKAFSKILSTANDNFFIDHKMCKCLEENGSSSIETMTWKCYRIASISKSCAQLSMPLSVSLVFSTGEEWCRCMIEVD